MRAKKIDDNQNEIVSALQKIGCQVKSLASVGDGMPDLLVALGSRLVLLEVKDGNKPPSQQKLTSAQERFHKNWRRHVYIVRSINEALDVVTK